MSATDADVGPVHTDAAAEAQAAAAAAANPALIGVPTFVVGSMALGLVLVGFVPTATAVGASIAIIMTATGIGQVIAAVWAAALGAGAVAAVFGIFGGFWLSYAALVLGLTHNWYGIPTDAVVGTQALFLISWLVVIVMLTLASLRLPVAFTVLFVLVDLALLFVLLGTVSGSTGLVRIGGICVFAFMLVGIYLFFDAMAQATGGRPLPLGRPVLK
jgi:succinate-acetate transporter protein